jgi:hypothetical protein
MVCQWRRDSPAVGDWSLVGSHGHFDSPLNVGVTVPPNYQEPATRLCIIKLPDFVSCGVHLPIVHYVCATHSAVGEIRCHHFSVMALRHIEAQGPQLVSSDGGKRNSLLYQESKNSHPVTSYNPTTDMILPTVHILHKLHQISTHNRALNHPVHTPSLIHRLSHPLHTADPLVCQHLTYF